MIFRPAYAKSPPQLAVAGLAQPPGALAQPPRRSRRNREAAMGCGASKVHAAPRFKMPELEYSTPMLVMPFEQFKAQGRICKSTKAWREEAFEKEWLVKYDEGFVKVVIFVSHT